MAMLDAIATFTRTRPSGEKQTRHAYTPAEVVSLLADGWVQQKNGKKSSDEAAPALAATTTKSSTSSSK